MSTDNSASVPLVLRHLCEPELKLLCFGVSKPGIRAGSIGRAPTPLPGAGRGQRDLPTAGILG
jgi:hypothetical protein